MENMNAENVNSPCLNVCGNGEYVVSEPMDIWNQQLTYTQLESIRPQLYNCSSSQNASEYCGMPLNSFVFPESGYQNFFNVPDASDEGIGSSPSSFHSESPPAVPDLVPENVHESRQMQEDTNSGYLIPKVESPYILSRLHNEPTTQCVKCGSSSNEGHWFPDMMGHVLCFHCYQVSPLYPDGMMLAGDKRRKKMIANRVDKCSNCSTQVTPLWRRTKDGRSVCNACGLYEKLHNKTRPLSMKKDVIQTRKRKPRSKVKAPSTEAHSSSNSPINTPAHSSPSLTSHMNSSLYLQTGNELPSLHPASTIVLPSINSGFNSAFYGNYSQDLSLPAMPPSVIVPIEKYTQNQPKLSPGT